MLELIFNDNGNFFNYGFEHLLSFLLWIAFVIYVLYAGRYQWNLFQQKLYITILISFAAFTQLFKIVTKLNLGTFDITTDLPLHLCNIMPFFMPFIMWYKNRFLWAFFFFWIIGGTFQSLITTTLTESFPHFENIRYWAVHSILTLAALYGGIVYRFDLKFKDVVYSWLGLNTLAAFIYPLNVALSSNYLYLNAKPAGTTMYDLLGPWPWYIVSLEFATFIIFSILFLIFKLFKNKGFSIE